MWTFVSGFIYSTLCIWGSMYTVLYIYNVLFYCWQQIFPEHLLCAGLCNNNNLEQRLQLIVCSFWCPAWVAFPTQENIEPDTGNAFYHHPCGLAEARQIATGMVPWCLGQKGNCLLIMHPVKQGFKTVASESPERLIWNTVCGENTEVFSLIYSGGLHFFLGSHEAFACTLHSIH